MVKKSFVHIHESKHAQYNGSRTETIEAVRKLTPFFDLLNRALTLDSTTFPFIKLVRNRRLDVRGVHSDKSSYKFMKEMIRTFYPKRDEVGK